MSNLPPGVASNAGANKTLEYIIGKAFLDAEKTCTSPWVLNYAQNLPGIPITFHILIRILSAVACIFNCLCAVYLMTGHTVYWVCPAEQRQMIRIILFDVIFSLSAFFSVYFYDSAPYNHAWAVYYENFAMVALFLLYVQMLCPNTNDRAQYFSSLQRLWYNGKVKDGADGSLRWFRIVWMCVFQVTVIRVATVIAQVVIEATYCPLSIAKANASIAIQVIQGVSTSITVYAIIVFEKRMHTCLADQGHRPMLKLISFKLVVGLEATQDVLFSALAQKGVYFPKPPYYVSWADFDVGIPSFILIWEMSVVSTAFLWSFTFEPYRNLVLQGEKVETSSWRAFLQSLDMRDVWRGTKYMFTCFTDSTYLEGHVDGRTVAGLAEPAVSNGEVRGFENKILVSLSTGQT